IIRNANTDRGGYTASDTSQQRTQRLLKTPCGVPLPLLVLLVPFFDPWLVPSTFGSPMTGVFLMMSTSLDLRYASVFASVPNPSQL
ncbi:hypothetical protein COL922a_014288, partial [Colletotrichum nupharicola]